MTQGGETCPALFTCGSITKITERFDDQTSFEEILDYVRDEFVNHLPGSYRIVYYDSTRKSLIDLEDQLRDGPSPFQTNASSDVQSTTSMIDGLRLYITVNRPVQTESTREQITWTNVTNNEESLSTNNEISQLTESLPAFIPHIIDLGNERLVFTLDVKSHQRDIYMSDQFNVRTGRPNGRIARIQGRKTDDEKMLQVLPRLRIPQNAIQSNVTLLVAAVSEKLDAGERIWYRHPDKGFLPEIFDRDTEPINPVILRLDGNNITRDGEYTLNLQMITKWAKSRNNREEIHRYDDDKTRTSIHSAETHSKSPRLLCVLQQNGQSNWNTFCLSDFIRSTKSSPQRSTSTSPETINSPKRKRSRFDD